MTSDPERTFDTVEPPYLAELVASLIGSKYRRPVTVQVVNGTTQEMIEFVVTRLGVKFLAPVVSEIPDYEFEGWVYQSGFDPVHGVRRIRGTLQNAQDGFHWECNITEK